MLDERNKNDKKKKLVVGGYKFRVPFVATLMTDSTDIMTTVLSFQLSRAAYPTTYVMYLARRWKMFELCHILWGTAPVLFDFINRGD